MDIEDSEAQGRWMREWLRAHRGLRTNHIRSRAANRRLKSLAEWTRRWMETRRQARIGRHSRNPQPTRDLRRQGSLNELQEEILKRDGRRCHICGGDILLFDKLHFDHVIPTARGGKDTVDNIKPSHGRCNVVKWAHPLAKAREILRERYGITWTNRND